MATAAAANTINDTNNANVDAIINYGSDSNSSTLYKKSHNLETTLPLLRTFDIVKWCIEMIFWSRILITAMRQHMQTL